MHTQIESKSIILLKVQVNECIQCLINPPPLKKYNKISLLKKYSVHELCLTEKCSLPGSLYPSTQYEVV